MDASHNRAKIIISLEDLIFKLEDVGTVEGVTRVGRMTNAIVKGYVHSLGRAGLQSTHATACAGAIVQGQLQSLKVMGAIRNNAFCEML